MCRCYVQSKETTEKNKHQIKIDDFLKRQPANMKIDEGKTKRQKRNIDTKTRYICALQYRDFALFYIYFLLLSLVMWACKCVPGLKYRYFLILIHITQTNQPNHKHTVLCDSMWMHYCVFFSFRFIPFYASLFFVVLVVQFNSLCFLFVLCVA